MPALRSSHVRVFALTIFHLLYLIIGAAIFAAIEGPEESKLKKALRDFRQEFGNQHKHCISGKSSYDLEMGKVQPGCSKLKLACFILILQNRCKNNILAQIK